MNNHNFNFKINNRNFNYNTPRTSYYEAYPNTSRSKKNKPSSLILMGVFFLIMGIIISVISLNEYKNYMDIADDGNSTTAYVTNVDRKTTKRTSRSSHRTKSGRRRKTTTTETTYDVTATYTVDGENYPVYFTSKSAYSEGETFTVLYEEGKPSNYVRKGDFDTSIVFGVILIIAGIVSDVIGIKRYRDEKDLKAMGLL